MDASYITPAVTLFAPDGTLDLGSQEALFENLICSGIDGILGLSDERFDRDGEGIAELVNLYSLADDDDRELVMHILKKYKNAGISHE